MTKTAEMSCSAAPALAAEDYLNELPYRITRTIERKCPTWGNNVLKTQILYELTLDMFLFEHKIDEVKLRYLLYYRAVNTNLYVPQENEIVGERTGIGHRSIKAAVQVQKMRENF